MDQGRESPPIPTDDQQTTTREDSERTSDSNESSANFLSDSQEDSSDLSADKENSSGSQGESNDNAVEISNAGLFADFRQQIEVFFVQAEGAISMYRFDLVSAKDLVLRLKDVAHRYMTKGCEEPRLEDIVVNRALTTVDRLVNGVQMSQEEVFDPRQMMVYLYCAIAVFPNTLQLESDGSGVKYLISPAGGASLRQLTILSRYCDLKTECEEMQGWHNMILHKQLLFDLAIWLEVDRGPVTFLITNTNANKISALLGHSNQLARMFEMHGVNQKLKRLWDLGVVLEASALVRKDFMRAAQIYHRLLMKVDTTRLPPTMVTRHSFVYARLLQNCREFAKALDHATEALCGVTDKEERREIEDLINQLSDAMEETEYQRDICGPPDEEWLAGTNAVSNQCRTDHQEAARQSHLSRMETIRQKTRRVSVSKRGQTPSPDSSGHGRRPRGATPDSSAKKGNRSSSMKYSSTPDLSGLPNSIGYCAADQAHGASISWSRKNLLNSSDLDDSDDENEEDDVDREIHFFYSSDEGDDEAEKGHMSDTKLDRTTTVFGAAGGEEDQHDWFEKSEQVIAQGEVDVEEEDIDLSEGQASDFERGGEGRAFYPDFYKNADQLLKSDPAKYKRCQLKIERCHLCTAKVLDKGSKFSEILIDGRSKAGRTYMDDEVVVEILAKSARNSGPQLKRGMNAASVDESEDKRVYGKVVGLLRRVNFANVEHPVLFCTLDETEGHLMKPLCRTVPKIHVMNDTVKRKYPTLKKNRIEIKTISSDGRVHHKEFCDVKPDKREQYVFKVVLLAWRQRNIYPLGAVLEAHIGGRDYSGGLQVLSMQQRAPKLYPRAAVEDTKMLAQETAVTKTGRRDMTAERLFTIDPPGSKDLDDAIGIRREGPHVVIGVHIADVAAVVKKDTGLDLEARRRAVTFYPLNRKPRCMLPEPLSHGKCSLLPDKERLAFSVFFKFNENGKQVQETEVCRSVIKSKQQLTYEQAQKVIDGQVEVKVQPSIQEDIRQIHKITSKLREKRQGQSMLFVPFEDPRLSELEKANECMAAHALIEELMILTNSYIAKRLNKRPRFRDCMIMRCHKAPTFEELREWQEKEGHLTNLVMQLQGKQITPSTQLSVNNASLRGLFPQPPIVVQRQIWKKLCQHLEKGEVEEARKLAFMDALHPLQCLATNSWMDLMETAEYKCTYGLNGPDLRHFGLSLDVYTHFTSPIRRYADLHVQRLLHADLDGRSLDCGPDEVTELCQHINCATSRQKAFGKGCMALKVAEALQHQPLVFRAYIDKVDAEQLTLFVPSLQKVSDRKQELPFSVLGVSCQPELTTDTALRKDSVTVQWNRRYYDEKGVCPGSLIPVWNYHDRLQNRSANCAVVMTIRPDQMSISVKQEDWVKIMKTLASNNQPVWDTVPQPQSRTQSEVDFMSSEKGEGTVSQRPVQFKRVYTQGQIVQVQMSAEPRKGMLKPRTDILHTAVNASVCTLHVSEPVLTLTQHATRATRNQQFSNHKEYINAWMPLLEMEAAVGAGEGESAVVIDSVVVTMKPQESSNKLRYRGSFSLKASFCYKRCIGFGGKSAESIRQDDCKNDMSFPLDYLCLRYKTNCSSSVVSRVKESEVPDAVDRQYTWLAHASVVQVALKERKRIDGGDLVVTFALSPSSPPPPPQLLKKEGARLTLEILPKAEVDRRAQELLIQLQDPELPLARATAFGSKFPKLDTNHKKLGRKDENHEVVIPNSRRLPTNNTAQLLAIQKAMTKSVTMIQGPPGSGKTNTGIKLVYLYCKVNRQLEAEGKGKKTVLYCGPSNKSVDLVARELKSKLGPEFCPKIVRMYGSAIESKDYPVPRGDIRPTRALRDLSCDPDLQDVALHHLIRQDGKPSAERIAEFEKWFDKCRAEPDKYSVTDKELMAYRKLLFEASVEELKHYEVILATCAVGGSRRLVEGAEKKVFQLIIDECAMSPEPHSMVPIIATQPKQVVLIGDHKQLRPIIKCQAAAELGLDQSLFERLFQRFQGNTAFLDIQYRMHPEICAFPSREFYEGNLKTGYSSLWGGELLSIWPSHPIHPDRQVPHLLVDVRGKEEMLTVNTDQGNERSKSNSLEADKVIEIVRFLKKMCKVDLLKVKLLTQYNAQRHLLEEKLKTAIAQNMDVFDHYDKFKVKVSTVVSSQGGEWDFVILSTVRSLPSYKIEPNPTHGWCRSNLGFITDRNQVNVALTRARRGLFIVGNVELLRCDDVWRHLVDRYRKNGCCVDDPSQFPPSTPLRPLHRPRHVQPSATSEWRQVRSCAQQVSEN